jgi:hypothetical protein
LFFLVLFILGRWAASTLSYAFVLFPVITILLSAILEAAPVTLGIVVGTAVVAIGVYVGALAPHEKGRELDVDRAKG